MMRSKLVSTALFVALACLALPAFGQTSDQPAYILAFGGGFSEATDPHYTMTGTFGIRIGDGIYSLSSADMSTRLDPATKRRVVFSTMRTGFEKVLLKSGPFTLAAHADGGVSVGSGSAVGLVSGGGTLIYDIPRRPNLFIYGTYRALRSPQADPAAATVQSAVSIGIGLKLFKN